ILFLILFIPPPPRSTLFPYTTLFRSFFSFCRRVLTLLHLPFDLRNVHGKTGCAPINSRIHRAAPYPASAGNTTRKTNGCRGRRRSEEHTSELQSRENLVCRLLLEKKK